jgi:uncharacterized protein (TIGR02284 family)
MLHNMTHEVSDVPALLNDLVEVCQDGEHGYLTAAGDVGNSELASIFGHYAEQRAKFAKELRAEITRLGGSPAEHGTVSGALHRGWINVKSALTGSGSGAVIAACETGEDSAAAKFEQALDTNIPGETRAIVARQAKQVREAHSHMLRLKKEAESGAVFQKNEVKN